MDFSKYKIPEKPKKEHFIIHNGYSEEGLIFQGNKYKAPERILQKVKAWEEVIDEENYNIEKSRFYKSLYNGENSFQEDLFKEYGVVNNPKRFLAYELACEYSKYLSNDDRGVLSLRGIEDCFKDFVILIKE